MKNSYTIFISSSDSYSDIWPVFFDMFKKYWPEYDNEIVLNTQELDYQHKDLKIKCTKVGSFKNFGQTFRAGLDSIKSNYILLIMIDYIYMDKVNSEKIEEYFKFFIEDNLDSLCLEYQNYPNLEKTKHPELVYVLPPAPNIMFSYQIAFWKKSVLYEMVLPHEDPWLSEWFGSKRAEKMKIRLACPNKNVSWPIVYDLRGCLHQGKWLENAIEFLKSNNYSFDFKKRGLYTDGYKTLSFKIKIKWKIWKAGLKGSYYDLFKR